MVAPGQANAAERPATDPSSVALAENSSEYQVVKDLAWADINRVSAPTYLADLRFARDVEAFHRLGARALAEMLAELGREHLLQTAIEAKLRRYVERLDLALLRAVGGDRFPPSPMRVVGKTSR